MKKYLIYVFLLAFCSLVSCECEIRSAINPNDGNNRVDKTKITSLQYVIDHCSTNDTIDLSKFKTITDYKATVNKSVTIKKGDLKGETLTITSDGVTLENLTNVSVVGNASTKIANSSLKDLKIGSTSSRGTSNKIARPVVEIIKTNIKEDIAINLEESIVIATNSSAKNLCFNANNTQVDVCDTRTKFENIKTDKICKLVLEDGTSDTIPLPNVTDNGELTQVNVKAANSKKLQKLTVASGLYTVISDEEYPNFESLVVLGTYTADDGITIFKPNGLSYEMAQTFSRYEKDFTVKIEDDDYFINGIQQKFDRLSIGPHPCKISSNFPNRAGNYEFKFTLTVVGEKQAKLTPTLTKITVDSSMMKTRYLVGEQLDTTGLLVFGEYKLGEISYQAVIRDFDISPRNGALLNVEDTKATVSFGEKTADIDITITVGWSVTIIIDQTNDINLSFMVEKDKTLNEIKSLIYNGKTLESWLSETGTTFDFNIPITNDTIINIKWKEATPPKNHNIIYNNVSGADNSANPTTFKETDNITLSDVTKDGYTFDGWYDAESAGDKVEGWSAGDKKGDVYLWARWTEISQFDASGDFIINGNTCKKTALVNVITVDTTVVGSDSYWNKYCADNVNDEFKGVFIQGRTVTLSPYAIGKYEVTQELYEKVMDENPSETKGDNYPVENISWYRVIAFCNELSRLMKLTPCYTVDGTTDLIKLGISELSADNNWKNASCNFQANGYRLPTEVEWEFAARGGDVSNDHWDYAFSGIDVAPNNNISSNYKNTDVNLNQVGLYARNSSNKLDEVGSKKNNLLGIYDMSGNVYEWCWDRYSAIDSSTKITGADTGNERVIRGGSCMSNANNCCISHRNSISPTGTSQGRGFRLAQTITNNN